MSSSGEQNQAILDELERILQSREFANAERMARFLRYAVHHTLQGDRAGLKESVIGTEVFDRPLGYDPKVEPVVRNEARRLRAKLEDYYSRNTTPVGRITIPKGSYAVVFEPVEVTPAAPAPPPIAPAPAPRRPLLWIGAAIAILTAVAIAVFPSTRRLPVPLLTTVTSYPGYQSNPSLSPDGNQVAFIWTGENGGPAKVYIAGVNGGEPRRLTSDGPGETFPSWSPDGTRIAFVRRGAGLMLAAVRGGEERKVTNAYASPIAWSPDSRRMIFSDFTDAEHTALFSIDSLTGERRQLTTPPVKSNGDIDAASSPDGRQIAFVRCATGNCDVFTIPAEGGTPRQITNQHVRITGVAWRPDGNTLVFASRRRGQNELWQIDARGSREPELIPVAGEEAAFPAFARNAGGPLRMVYEQHVRDSNIWRAAVEFSKDGPAAVSAEPRRLIASTRLDDSPQVSPDGRKIAFVSNRSGFDEIWTVDINGSNAVEVTQFRGGHGVGSPRWSPDSNRLAFDAVGEEGRAVFVVDAAGGAARQWTAPGSASRPSWSRDGRWIYFGEKNAQGGTDVWKVSTADSRKREQVTHDGGFEAYESVDGSTLYYTRGEELRRMPSAGGASSAVPTGIRMAHGWWGLTARGIYFVDMYNPAGAPAPPPGWKGPRPIYFFDFAGGASRKIGDLTGDLVGVTPDFCVSPDGRSLYYSVLEISVSQIRMIEWAQ